MKGQLYLMHKHKCSLMTVVHLLICWICDTLAFHLFPPLSQVVVPQLVTDRKETNIIYVCQAQGFNIRENKMTCTCQAALLKPFHRSYWALISEHFACAQCNASSTSLNMDSWWFLPHKANHHLPAKYTWLSAWVYDTQVNASSKR